MEKTQFFMYEKKIEITPGQFLFYNVTCSMPFTESKLLEKIAPEWYTKMKLQNAMLQIESSFIMLDDNELSLFHVYGMVPSFECIIKSETIYFLDPENGKPKDQYIESYDLVPNGNCVEEVISEMLNIDIEDVPTLEEEHDNIFSANELLDEILVFCKDHIN